MRPFVKGPQQCFNCQKFGHHARTCRSEIQTCRYCAGRHHSHQCKDNKQLTLKCANCGQEHATTSHLCPKRMEAKNKEKTAPASQRTKTGQQETSFHTTGKRMGNIDRTESGETALFIKPSIPITTPTTIKETMEVSTKQSNPTARNALPKQCRTESQNQQRWYPPHNKPPMHGQSRSCHQ